MSRRVSLAVAVVVAAVCLGCQPSQPPMDVFGATPAFTLTDQTGAPFASQALAGRVTLLDFPPHTPVGHNEEHYVVETPHADRYAPGDVVYALPAHICPTVALHKEALIADDGRVIGAWPITARDRRLTV